MDSSDDDAPLVKRSNGVKSKHRVSASDKAKDLANGDAKPGISVRNGPVDRMEIDEKPKTNGVPPPQVKRKASSNAKYAEASSSASDDEDIPLSKRRKTSTPAKKPPKVKERDLGESSDDDVPLTKKIATEKAKIEKKAEKEAKSIRADDKRKSLNKKVKEESSDDDKPLASKAPAKFREIKPHPDKLLAAAKGKAKQSPVKRAKAKDQEQDDEENEEEEYRWWEDPTKGDGTKKWTTLEHNGVLFPPAYEPLPKNIRMKYNGVPVKLAPDAEEVATFYGSMLHSTVNVENPTFNMNFFKDFKEVLDKTGHAQDKDGNKVKITEFEKCDFKPIYEHFNAERERKKALSAAEKREVKAKKDEAESSYTYCLWDGRKQKVGNFRVEPPGLFRGRGEHPKTGKVKQRVAPEQITINIGKEAKVPAPPEGHKWKEIKHDQEGTWLAMWQENINSAYKYVMLAANSDIKGLSDYKKFEKSRELKKHIDRVRKDYNKNLKAELMADRQMATAVYLIDQFALRAGNEKSEDEADTVGCCSLKYEHVTLQPPNKVVFDFLGKDSIRFYNEVEVDQQVFKNLRIFKKDKGNSDEIFDRLTTSALNKHLSSYMDGLTAKVFRTYNASYTMANELKKMKPTGTVAEKVKSYNDANRTVAIICNHKRTVAAGHEGQTQKMLDRINGLRYQQWRLKQMILDLEPKMKKKKAADYFDLPKDLTPSWVEKHQAAQVEEQREKIKKKFDKDNEKAKADGEKPMGDKILQERLEVAKDLEKKYKKENKSQKVEAEGKGPSVEKYEGQLQKLSERIETMKLQLEDKEDNKEVALGTSKINYIDPRLTVVFCKKFDVPIEKFFSKTLREKFDWAIKSVDAEWEF